MTTWINFWQMLLIGIILVYGVVAVRVAIGGFGDIRRMLKQIDSAHDEKTSLPKKP